MVITIQSHFIISTGVNRPTEKIYFYEVKDNGKVKLADVPSDLMPGIDIHDGVGYETCAIFILEVITLQAIHHSRCISGFPV